MSIVEMKVPTIGESVTEVTLSQWLKEDGEYVKMDEPICEFESDKATLEFPAEASGKLIYVAAEGDDLEIGALVAKIDTSVAAEDGGGSDTPAEKTSAPESKEEAPAQEATPASSSETYATGHPSPAAAKLMKENGLSEGDIQGTGKDGRITKDDVQKAIEAKKNQPSPAPQPAKEETSTPPPAINRTNFSRDEERKKMSRMRRTIAKRLVSAKNDTAMLTTFNEIDMTGVIELRKKYQEKFVEKYGIKLGFMSLFAKACAKALLEKPDVNARLDGNDLIYHEYVDISIAISTPNGLVVPPVRNVESLSYAEFEYALKELAGKARNGTLSLEEMSGGTFTITNGGIFGSRKRTLVTVLPQAAG
jgi:2-oxoglutarate dehydrogenase E2 component (dihydrolipoamide succinyltransferase)